MVYLYTGPIRSGKTTALTQWAAGRDDVGGFLTPDRDGRRVLQWLDNGTQEAFELPPEATEAAIEVGRFRFSASAFTRVRAYLATADRTPHRWIVVDEVGKLEVRGRGFEPELGQLIRRMKNREDAHLLLVVRQSLVEEVRRRYGLGHVPSPTVAAGVLTALWAVSEAGLGGLLHLVRSPLTGIFVGGLAVLLISLLAHFSGGRPGRTILRALGTVLVVKALASPQSPPAAYLAVAFQGLVGAALFSSPLGFRGAAFLLGLLALVESALQKILVLTLVFGRALWEAVEALLGSAAALIWIYVATYAVAGGVIGWFASRLPGRIEGRLAASNFNPLSIDTAPATAPEKKSGWRRFLLPLVLLSFILVAFARHPAALGSRTVSGVVLRVIGALLAYYLLLAPIVRRLVLNGSGEGRGAAKKIVAQLPRLKRLGILAWRESAHRRGPARLAEAAERWITYALLAPPPPEGRP